MPELAELDRLATRLATLRDLAVAAEAERGDLDREQRKAEADVDQVRQRAERDRERASAGKVGSARELESLQHEIASLTRRQADLEDVVLAIMERVEAADERVRELAAERERLERQARELAERRDAAFSELDAEAGQAADARKSMAAALPAELVALYEKLREQFAGVAVAALRRGRCDGCQLELDISELNAIRSAPPEKLVRCDNCRRLLIRLPESGL